MKFVHKFRLQGGVTEDEIDHLIKQYRKKKRVGQADYLVTKNIRHFPYKNYQNVQIVKISKFLKVLETEFPD